ncbi:MMPL family transporter [Sphaerisporangium corydalis]|uniref:MMPL family transporter n=1 Tax=Sphaerisporangium corydalis TaxID=1441875 RepID=A0ABV9EUC6_9ACTN|nr:MMPL family transporter [Sphaerisporangium corydalis]
MSTAERRTLTVRVANWSGAHPWRAIIGWFLFVTLCLVAGSMAGTRNATTEDYRVGEAGRAEAFAAEGDLQRRPVEQILVRARSGALDPAAARAAADDLTARMKDLPEVLRVDPPVRSADGQVLRVDVTMAGPELEARGHVAPLLERTAAVQRSHPGLVVEETGSASISKGLDRQRGEDFTLSEAIALPVTLVTLLAVFGSVLMAGVPLLLALSSIAASMGVAMVASHLFPDAGVGSSVILLIGLAVGVDYTLFYLKREREERARAQGRLDSEAVVRLAAATSGRAIMVSGLAVVVSSATLYLAADVIFSSLATATIAAVLVAMASSVTVLPALLVKIGQRSERRAGRQGGQARTRRWARAGRPGSGRAWSVLLRPASRHPVITLCVALLLMGALALPALGMRLRVLNRDSHSRQIQEVSAWDRLTGAFPDMRTRHQVVVRSDPARAGQVALALRDLGRRAGGDPLFAANFRPVVQTSADGRISVLELRVPYRLSSPEAAESLTRIRRDLVPATAGRVPGAEVAVTGDVARDADYLANQDEKLPLVVGFLLLLTFVMTVVVFRSVVLGLLGVALNLLSVAAAFGLLVVFFQHGLATTLFGFDASATGGIGSRVPLFLLVILFGLSMDYQVFVVSRIREAALRGVPARQAVVEGLTATAGVVTSAAFVMVTVFTAFVFLHLAELKQIGFALATAVLLDAFVIRVLILPSAMTLLGRASWWPSREMRRAASSPPGLEVSRARDAAASPTWGDGTARRGPLPPAAGEPTLTPLHGGTGPDLLETPSKRFDIDVRRRRGEAGTGRRQDNSGEEDHA